uniref:Glucose-6-phosphate 1-dehydrogenase n=1 Tax=Cyanidium caldarium TaxID=2771 RepID=Q9STD4_CYACA|nr:glucose-6-phosphate 1-dehydrogenase [Cyanidium caldarium]
MWIPLFITGFWNTNTSSSHLWKTKYTKGWTTPLYFSKVDKSFFAPRLASIQAVQGDLDNIAPQWNDSSLETTLPITTNERPAIPRQHFSHLGDTLDPSLMDSVKKRKQRAKEEPLCIVVIGASGDLAKKKTFPALFSLYYHDLLPKDFLIVGYARRQMTQEEFRNSIMESLTCRVIDGPQCQRKMDEFLPKCHYMSGMYDRTEDFVRLDQFLNNFEQSFPNTRVDRLYYLAVPSQVFENVVHHVHESGRTQRGWNRIVMEKPFGKDITSYLQLRNSLRNCISEDEIYRIDHYLGKELVQNLMVLRFANYLFEPLWNRDHIASIQIVFKENFGVEGRAGYFDEYGIIRDIMQNHLLQVMALLGMEQPVTLHAEDIRDEKVKFLRSIRPLKASDFVLGQYRDRQNPQRSYLSEPGVMNDSHTPTFAACVFQVDNRRWSGVPFLMKAGKALDERKAEIRIQFQSVPGGLFSQVVSSHLPHNELVIIVQPDEAIYMRILSKAPGFTSRLEEARLNLFYRTAWEDSKDIPDAYERLILDVIHGEKSLFIRDDELEVAWNIFTPSLKEMEMAQDSWKPILYDYGGRGPIESDYLAAKYAVQWSEGD